jgi:hypothetical protein
MVKEIKDTEYETIIKDGRTIAQVAITEPKIPPVIKPAKVAIFIPTGPGVTDETARTADNS